VDLVAIHCLISENGRPLTKDIFLWVNTEAHVKAIGAEKSLTAVDTLTNEYAVNLSIKHKTLRKFGHEFKINVFYTCRVYDRRKSAAGLCRPFPCVSVYRRASGRKYSHALAWMRWGQRTLADVSTGLKNKGFWRWHSSARRRFISHCRLQIHDSMLLFAVAAAGTRTR
jgi:hypothetical protein